MKETGHQVRKSGFVLSESHPFLGSSSVGITEEDKLVEVKKVVSKEEDLIETMCRLSVYKKDRDGISIDKNHKIDDICRDACEMVSDFNGSIGS